MAEFKAQNCQHLTKVDIQQKINSRPKEKLEYDCPKKYIL
jgi:hypothetical protein